MENGNVSPQGRPLSPAQSSPLPCRARLPARPLGPSLQRMIPDSHAPRPETRKAVGQAQDDPSPVRYGQAMGKKRDVAGEMGRGCLGPSRSSPGCAIPKGRRRKAGRGDVWELQGSRHAVNLSLSFGREPACPMPCYRPRPQPVQARFASPGRRAGSQKNAKMTKSHDNVSPACYPVQ